MTDIVDRVRSAWVMRKALRDDLVWVIQELRVRLKNAQEENAFMRDAIIKCPNAQEILSQERRSSW